MNTRYETIVVSRFFSGIKHLAGIIDGSDRKEDKGNLKTNRLVSLSFVNNHDFLLT